MNFSRSIFNENRGVQLYYPIIDAHIHLDLYKDGACGLILDDLDTYRVEALISVSQDLSSAEANLKLSHKNSKVKPAFGFHPEQFLPKESEIIKLQQFIELHQESMIAVGEIGLPYYLRKEDPNIRIEPYIELLESFIQQAATLDKPVILHAVYEDAPIVCTLLEEYGIKKAHFHWFKGDKKTIEQMIENRYYISITPDVLYEKEIQQLVKCYPLSLMMVETDGPWEFEGIFKNQLTHPKMIHQTVHQIAKIKGLSITNVYQELYVNTKHFYGLDKYNM